MAGATPNATRRFIITQAPHSSKPAKRIEPALSKTSFKGFQLDSIGKDNSGPTWNVSGHIPQGRGKADILVRMTVQKATGQIKATVGTYLTVVHPNKAQISAQQKKDVLAAMNAFAKAHPRSPQGQEVGWVAEV